MKEELQKLIEQYGADAVAKAAAEALNKHVPTINTPVVTDEQLLNTISQLDAAVTDILEAGRKNEETYQNKVELARRARQLETSIQITEAEAINTICGTGKDAYGIIPYPDGTHVRVAVTNDTQRDALLNASMYKSFQCNAAGPVNPITRRLKPSRVSLYLFCSRLRLSV